MTAQNPFVLEAAAYKRDLSILTHYIEDQALHLRLRTGKSLDECRAFVKRQIGKGGRFELKDPKVVYLHRGDNGDRVQKETTMLGYLSDSIRNGELIAPTFTTYKNPKELKSVLVDFIDGNVKSRSKAKKEMFAAEMAGNTLLQTLKKLEQGNKKIANNSISGAHVSNSTPLYNKTAHSTLTSNCRTTSGYGNANNEKFLCGNRHYWNPKIALNNLISVARNTDYAKLTSVMNHYGIRAPSVDETMQCITYSTDLYWRNRKATAEIRKTVEAMDDFQRAAFVYTGDLYHLAKYNDSVVRTFLDRLTEPVRKSCDNATAIIKAHREEYRHLVVQFFPDQMKGKTIRDVEGQEIEQWLASTIMNVDKVIQEYAPLIDALWVTKNAPASLAFLPESIRRAALTSDTDSTIFTVQDWVFWRHGEDPGFNEKTYATEATMIWLAAETITHVLARMSANFGIETDRIHQVAMKNEFKFDVFIPTNVGKHYFAYISYQEGNLFAKMKKEIKGVHLKNSNVPRNVMDQAQAMMIEIMDEVLTGKKLSLLKYLKKVADIEREVKRSILAAESVYFRTAMIKTAEAYQKSKEESPYQHYTLWQEVFAEKYGDAPLPPYSAIKISVELDSPTAMKEWYAKIPDRQMAAKIEAWMTKYGKRGTQSFLLPEQCLNVHGIPEEIACAMDMRKIIFDVVSTFYLILETLGYYTPTKKLTNLVSDQY